MEVGFSTTLYDSLSKVSVTSSVTLSIRTSECTLLGLNKGLKFGPKVKMEIQNSKQSIITPILDSTLNISFKKQTAN